jgi:SPP1 gp7 family putative phage head morphogenesis protein
LKIESIEAIDIAGWMEVMERLAKETYEGKIKQGELDPGYILETYKKLNQAAEKGYGKDWLKVNGSTGTIAPEILKMQQNLYKFSGAKNYAMLEEINQILQKNKSWNDFKNDVLALNPKYNKNYLQAEWQTAKQSAMQASNWEHYLENTKLYPNLKYKTQGDERVREAHKVLNEIIAPVNSDFWKTHYPPNGWRCRCYVVQTAEPATEAEKYPKISEKDFPLEFRGNSGISGEIFKEDESNKGKPHPYFALAKTAYSETQKAFELSKLAAPLNVVHKAKNRATVEISPFADARPSELLGNYRDAVLIADELKQNVKLPAHLDGTIILGNKNPEFIIDNKKADRKNPENKNTKNLIGKAEKQGCEVVVFNLSNTNATKDEIIKDLESRFRFDENYPTIKEVIIIEKNRKIQLYKREEFKQKKAK